MSKGQRLKNQIHANCVACDTKRLVAYWDEELESYIYLCDIAAPLCVACSAVSEKLKYSNVDYASVA